MIKTIDSIQYHVWSDALHALALARMTQSRWDRGAYVRWSIQTAWSAFENVCTEVLQVTGLGNRFKERFDNALQKNNLPAVDWSQGVWQKVRQVYELRKKYVHVVPSVSHHILLASISEAESAINVLREGIKDLLNLVGLPHPAWVNDNDDQGWHGPSGTTISVSGSLTAIHAGADEEDPNVVRITYFKNGKEYVSELAPPETPHSPLLDRLVSSLNVPVEAVRAYRGIELLEERFPSLR